MKEFLCLRFAPFDRGKGDRRKEPLAGFTYFSWRKGMNDPEILDRILQSCSFRFRNVTCPNKDKEAHIAAVKIHGEEEGWSVVECSLLPNGEVKCAMSCLLRDFDSDES
jgi:hypothetical protein